MSSFLDWSYKSLFYKTTYLYEEVNGTEPSPSVSGPCLGLLGNQTNAYNNRYKTIKNQMYEEGIIFEK